MSATTATKSFLPTGKEAISEVKNLGGLVGGMIAANALLKLTKKDNAMINGGIAVVGLLAAIKVSNPTLKMVALGVSALGTIKLLNNILPESAKALIGKFIPTLSGADDEAYHGMDDENYRGIDKELEGLSLDDLELRGTPSSELLPSTDGLGEVFELVA